MFLGYLLTADELSSEEQSSFARTIEPFEQYAPHKHLNTTHYSLSVFAHGNIPLDRRIEARSFTDAGIDLVFIGRVYTILSEQGDRAASWEDILSLYRQHGAHFFDFLSGEFVCLLHDRDKEHFFLAVDHIGSIPCYFMVRENAVFFSSHAPTLAVSDTASTLTSEFVEKQFHSYAPGYSITPLSSMHKIMPGSCVQFRRTDWQEHIYWQPEKIAQKQNIDFQEARNTLKTLLTSSLENRLDKAYTIGTHLSGGLDSCLLTDWTRNLCRDQLPFMSFSWSPPKSQLPLRTAQDERNLIDAFCKERDIHILYTEMHSADYLAYLDDGAFPQDFPYERLAQPVAEKYGVNLIVSAWGTDEFAGIDNHAVLNYLFRRGKWRSFFARNADKTLRGTMAHLVNEGLFPRRRKGYARWKTSLELRQFLHSIQSLQMKDVGFYRSPRHMMLGTLAYGHVADRCEYWYNSGHCNGVVYTYPFLDKRLIEYCLQLPADIFTHGDHEKPLIRSLVREMKDGEEVLAKQLPDPILFEHLRKIQRESCAVLIGRINDYAHEPALSIFKHQDFNIWLQKLDLHQSKDLDAAQYLLSYLAAAHAAIQTYTNRPNSQRQ